MSIGRSSPSASTSAGASTSWPSSVATPTTAYGQRSRSHSAANSSSEDGAIASTYRSWLSFDQISRGARPVSSSGTFGSTNRAPSPAPSTSSGNAFDRPPAPTSWIDRIGLASPRFQQWLMTSCARRWISGLPRCTESKSSSAALAPAAIDDAAPPPRPMRMPGPPIWISSVPAAYMTFSVWLALMNPSPPALMIGLW